MSVLLLVIASPVSFPAAAHSTTDTIRIGSTTVRLVTTTGEYAGGITYFHPHENERTAAEAVRKFVKQNGGTLLEIESAGTRLISFVADGEEYRFDPNRMFTDIGLQRSLADYSRYSPQAAAAVRPLREAVLSKLSLSGMSIVAVHNNAAVGMNINEYRDSGILSKEAAQVAAPVPSRPHDFFLVLDPILFSNLKSRGFNVVLQSPRPTDDGSLSVYSQENGIKYVNVEAREDEGREQMRMLQVLRPLL